MPTNRKRKSRLRVMPVPDWAKALVTDHVLPQKETEAWEDFLDWRFFGDQFPGLPEPESPEGQKLLEAAKDAE